METKIGRYEITSELGRGAMGVVYRAQDPIIGREVALKTIRNTDGLPDTVYSELSERFLREARAAGRLQHANVVTILDAGTDEVTGISFIAMELISGRDLDVEMREGRRFTVEETVEIIAAAARGLEYAHENGVVHRDIKPGNLLLDAKGDVKVTDFGIAHIAESGLTRTGQVIGSPAYMSPEQIAGTAVDRRSDIFSLGVVLYQLLTGERPFQGEGLTSLAYQIVHTEPIPLSKINPAVAERYCRIVAASLVKDRERRYQTAADLASDLEGTTSIYETLVGTETFDPDATHNLSGGTLLNASSGGTGTVIGTPTSQAGSAPAAGAASGQPPWLLPVAVAFGAIVLAGAIIFRPSSDGGASSDMPAPVTEVTETTDAEPAGTPASRTTEPTLRALNPPVAAVTEDARLLVDFEHFLASGTIWVSVDDEVVYTSSLAAKKKSRFGISKLKVAKEHLIHEITVPSGRHTVAVEVRSGDGTVNDRKVVQTDLSPNHTNIFDIGISRVNKGITLELKP